MLTNLAWNTSGPVKCSNAATSRTLLPMQFPMCLLADWALVQVVVSGLHVNNTANILGSFQVCNSTVYIIDVVLLPADSLQAIPQAPATPPRAGETRRLQPCWCTFEAL